MTVDRFLRSGEAEVVKGAVHGAVCGLALVCGIYNAAAWVARRERHLGVNAILYTGLAIWEAVHVRHHHRHRLREVCRPQWVESPLAGASTASYMEIAS